MKLTESQSTQDFFKFECISKFATVAVRRMGDFGYVNARKIDELSGLVVMVTASLPFTLFSRNSKMFIINLKSVERRGLNVIKPS